MYTRIYNKVKVRVKSIILLCLFTFLPLSLLAQSEAERYRTIYDQAEQDYNIGRLEEAQQALKNNLSDFPLTLRMSAFRMLSLCCLGLDQDAEAENYVRMMLDENPYYSTTASDPQRFIDMVENIRAGHTATITTASSQAEQLNEVPVPTTLITREMIKDCGARNLQEVLATYVPGMNIIDCNDDINIAMRGIYSNGQEKILIMLNGHRLNSFATNIASPDFSMSLEKVKQIEVLRGPASSLYGGVSLTAVVNVITKQGADVDGVEARAGIGTYGQIKGGMLFGKRYFDLDVLIWGSLYKAKGESTYMPQEETGMKMMGGNVTIGGIGPKPSYDFGVQLKYGGLQFLYNSCSSQVISPFTMTYTFSPYTLDKYRTQNGLAPSFATFSQHANLSYSGKLGNVWLKGTVTYDNSDLTHYQVINEPEVSAMAEVLPVPEVVKQQLSGQGGISRYLNGQEHTVGGKLQGDWSYIDNGTHRGLFTFGVEYSYFELDDVRYNFGYDFIKLIRENDSIPMLGKGHESNMNGFVQMKHHWRSFILNAGLRYDYKNRYNDTKIREFSPRLALIYVQPKWNLKLSYSKAFIDAPYMYRKINLFLANFMGYTQAAPELHPESLYSWQLTFGANQWLPGLNFEMNAFYNNARDLIVPFLIEHFNSGHINTYGLELTASYQRHRLSAHFNATWQDVSHNSQAGYSYDHALNIPTITANGIVAWQTTRNLRLHTRIGLEGRQHTSYIDILNYAIYQSTLNIWMEKVAEFDEYLNSPDYDSDVSEEKLAEIERFRNLADEQESKIDVNTTVPARVIFDLGASYQWRNVTLTANIKNLFNHHYRQSGMSTCLVPQRGRWLMFEIAYKF